MDQLSDPRAWVRDLAWTALGVFGVWYLMPEHPVLALFEAFTTGWLLRKVLTPDWKPS